ncbi:WD40 repeat domain-containing protein [Tepidamorphus sp. 3E244]|uniref:WD40 repeat domain-containing protein n=1 Tax=Tepidamorphus sp. 3E244 TaxID=3385498 RepID=UPI0038FCFBED
MNMMAIAEVDHGTTTVPEGISAARLKLAANITMLRPVSHGDGQAGFVAGLGNGQLVSFDTDGEPGSDLVGHRAAVTGMVGYAGTVFTTAQDSCLIRHDLDAGKSETVLQVAGQWLHGLTRSAATGRIACIARKAVHVLPDGSGPDMADFHFDTHPSSASGVAFSPDGQRIAVAHYDGITLWPLDGSGDGEVLKWKGSHIGVTWSPDGRFIVSATQERELHVWDLVTEKDYRLGGYPAKTHSMVWTMPDQGPVKLACSGADVITAWPFGDVGPGRLPPVEIGYVYTGRVTQVAANPVRPLVAGGYTVGTVLVGGLAKGEAMFARTADGSEISSLAWAEDGMVLAAGTRGGDVELMSVRDLAVS